MKLMTKLFVAALLMCAVSAQAAKVLTGWAPTMGYKNSDSAAWQDDGKIVTLKGIDRGKWILFRNAPTVPAKEGQNLQITLKNVKLKGEVLLGYYAYSSGYGCSAQQDVSQKDVNVPSLTVTVPVKGKTTNFVRPRICIMPGAEISFSAIEFKVTGKAAAVYTATAVPDKADALYNVGDTVKFTLKVTEDGKELTEGKADIFLYKNGIYNKKFTFDLSNGPAVISYKMDEPGFVVVNAQVTFKGKVIIKNIWGSQIGAAGFGVDKIKSGKPAPADLLDYWHGEYAKLCKEVPADFQKKLVNSNGSHFRYELTCNNFGGTKTYATITVPKKPGKYPIIFTVPPAGNSVYSYNISNDAIRVTIAVFDRTFSSQSDYMKFNKKEWYFYKGAQQRNTYYYYKSILGMMRVMDYAMKEIPEWDGKHLAAFGRSQGGGSAIIMSALNQKIQCVSADVPALCDHNGRAAGRRPGWPQLLDNSKAKGFGNDAQYFDAANFAEFVKCPAVVSVGFYDTMCEPASVYAAFNNLKGEKKIINCITYGHGWGKRDNTYDKETDLLLKKTFAK